MWYFSCVRQAIGRFRHYAILEWKVYIIQIPHRLVGRYEIQHRAENFAIFVLCLSIYQKPGKFYSKISLAKMIFQLCILSQFSFVLAWQGSPKLAFG